MKCKVCIDKTMVDGFVIKENGESVLRPRYYNYNKPLFFNRTATYIINILMKDSNSIDSIVGQVMKEYNIDDEKQITNDVMTLLKKLWECYLLKIQGENPLVDGNMLVLSNEETIYICDANFLEKMIKFIKKTEAHCYVNPYLDRKEFLNSDGIRSKIVNRQIVAFIYVYKGEICNVVILQNLLGTNTINNIFIGWKACDLIDEDLNRIVNMYRFAQKHFERVNDYQVFEILKGDKRLNTLIEKMNYVYRGDLILDVENGDISIFSGMIS